MSSFGGIDSMTFSRWEPFLLARTQPSDSKSGTNSAQAILQSILRAAEIPARAPTEILSRAFLMFTARRAASPVLRVVSRSNCVNPADAFSKHLLTSTLLAAISASLGRPTNILTSLLSTFLHRYRDLAIILLYARSTTDESRRRG